MKVPMPKQTLQEIVPDPVDTRRCRNCSRDLSAAFYSMWLSRPGTAFHAVRSSKIVCNSCLTRAGTGFFREETAWQMRKACTPEQADLFFPEGIREIKQRAWASICDGCPVRRECLEFGDERRSTGVFGGVYLEEGREPHFIEDPVKRRARIIDLYRRGMSVERISKDVGLSTTAIFDHLRKTNVQRRYARKKK